MVSKLYVNSKRVNYTGLASGGKRPVPYGAVEAATEHFIDIQYQPPSFVLKDPSKLSKDAVISFLKHILDRQRDIGVDDAFKFRIYTTKKGEHQAKYPKLGPADHSPVAAKSKKSKKKRPKPLHVDQAPVATPQNNSAGNQSAALAGNGSNNNSPRNSTGEGANGSHNEVAGEIGTQNDTGRQETSAGLSANEHCDDNEEETELEKVKEKRGRKGKITRRKGKKRQKSTAGTATPVPTDDDENPLEKIKGNGGKKSNATQHNGKRQRKTAEAERINRNKATEGRVTRQTEKLRQEQAPKKGKGRKGKMNH